MNLSTGYPTRRRTLASLVIIAVLLSFLPALSVSARSAGSPARGGALAATSRGPSGPLIQVSVSPPTDAQCRAKTNMPCYSPQEIRTAYGVAPLIGAGITGKGQTIVIIDSFGSPTIRQDLKAFDAGYGLPDPPSFRVLTPLGTIAFNPQVPDMVGWAAETTLDVEWAHAIAPGANIVLMTSPVDETQGVQGLPEFLFLEQYAVSHHLGKIISQSWGATENTLFTPGGRQLVNAFNDFYKQAGAQGVTFLASTGDAGVANPDINGKIFPFPTVGFPASSPYVTAVGGTSLFATTSGVYQSERVWNEGAAGGATGGGVSQIFAEPSYQTSALPASDQHILNGHRGIPDIAYNADPFTPILIYLSFLGASKAGFYTIGGTSEGSPQWAGIVADGNQLAGRPLGFLNPALYQLGKGGDGAESFHDVTVGNNSFGGITGYSATPGWDPTTGWGSPKAATMLSELIEITGGSAS